MQEGPLCKKKKPPTHLGLCGLKLDKTDALELARLAVGGQPHIHHGAALAKRLGQLVAHLVLAWGREGGDPWQVGQGEGEGGKEGAGRGSQIGVYGPAWRLTVPGR